MSGQERHFALLARGVGGIVATIGALILLGWALDEVIVPSGVEGAPAVKANAGLCFLLVGTALSRPWAGRAALVPRVLGAVVAVIGALTLTEYLFGVDLGIDQLLFSDSAEPTPGRIPPNGAFCFVLLGGALLLPEHGGRGQASEYLALTAAMIGWLAVVGHATGLSALVEVGGFLRMPSVGAASFVLAGTAIVFAARPGRLAKLVAGGGSAAYLTRRVLVAIMIVPPIVGLVARASRSVGILDEGAVTLLLVGSVALTMVAVTLYLATWLERSEEARSMEEKRRQGILDTAGDAIVSADSAGLIVAFNRAAERTFGLSAADALGEPLTILMPERFHDAHQAGLRRYLSGGEARVVGAGAVELAGRRASGEEFPLELSLSAFGQGGETVFTGRLTDITERKRAEAYRTAQHEVSRVFATTASTTEALEALARALGERLGWPWVAFWAVDRPGESIRCETTWHDPGLPAAPFERASREASFPHGTGLPGRVWAESRAKWIDDVVEDPNFPRAAAAAEAGLHCGVAVPLRRGGDVVGVLELLSPRPLGRDDLLVDVLLGIGEQVGQYLERKRAEEELHSSEALLKQSQKMAHLGSWEWDVAADEVTWSDELYAAYGIGPGELQPSYDGFLERVHPDDREAMEAAVGKAYSTGEPFDLDHRIVRPDGSVRVLHAHGEVTRDERGNPVRLAGTGQDVTEQREAEIVLARQAELLDLAHDAVIVREPSESRITYWNREAEEIYGYSAEEARGRIIRELLDAGYPESLEAIDAVLLERGRWEGEITHRRKDGRLIVVLSRHALQVDERGEPAAILEINSDITDRKRAGRQAERLAAILAYADDAIVAVTPEGEVSAWNRGAERLFGYGPDEVLGRPSSFLVPSDRAGEDGELLARAIGGEHVEHFETVRQTKDARLVEVAMTLSPFYDAEGEPIGISAIARDISDRKRNERQLIRQADELEERAADLARQADELERSNAELEQFAYVASHDLQEPLRSVSGFVQLLQRRYKGQLDAEADRFIGFAVEGAERMQTLIEDLLRYSRAGRRELRRAQVDSRAVVERTLAALDAAVREAGAEVELGELPTVVADEAALGQVFQNLIGNALKYHDGEPPRVAVSATPAGDGWSFEVADNGIGIDSGHAERIFRMFQRLHARDEYGGTGIGLAICKRVVERHGGRIWFDSPPGGGTVFHFTIPDGKADEE